MKKDGLKEGLAGCLVAALVVLLAVAINVAFFVVGVYGAYKAYVAFEQGREVAMFVWGGVAAFCILAWLGVIFGRQAK